MLPLVFKTLNANGVTDYNNGLNPDIEISEDFSNLGILGDENEPLLARALMEILGLPLPLDTPFRVQQISELKTPLHALDGQMFR